MFNLGDMVSAGVRLKDSGRYLDCARSLVQMSRKPWDVWLLPEPVTFGLRCLGLGFFPIKNLRKASWGD